MKRTTVLSARPSPPRGPRLRLRISRKRVDRELADGVPPERSDLHALRGSQLVDPLTRHELAIQMRTAIAAAEHPGTALRFGSVRRDTVIASREGLLGLAERLENGDAINPCGVARARALLTDKSGPLYSCLSGASVRDALWWIADGLRLCPPHQ
jgi:hypothetical protein